MLKKFLTFFNKFNFFYLKKSSRKLKFFLFNLPKKEILIILKINLDQIKYFIKNKDFNKNKSFYLNGNWDKKKIELKYYNKFNINYKSVFQIFKYNIKYYETDEYKYKKDIIKSGQITQRGQKNLAELRNYFIALKKIKNSIELKGYLSQKQLGLNSSDDEVGVVIGRNGEIIKLQDKFGGTHRFAICKILKKKFIYVNVVAIHQKFIDKVISNKLYKNFNKKMIIELLENKIKSK